MFLLQCNSENKILAIICTLVSFRFHSARFAAVCTGLGVTYRFVATSDDVITENGFVYTFDKPFMSA